MSHPVRKTIEQGRLPAPSRSVVPRFLSPRELTDRSKQENTMPTPPLLDFDELVAPIPGDDPAGGSIPFAVREKLEEFRKEVDPDQFDADDPMRPESFQKADWEGIIELAKETLTGTSKDLLIGARLTEALVKEHGFAGLRDGLHLLLRLVAECWDRLRPAIESDDDLEIRAGPFNWLDESDRGAPVLARVAHGAHAHRQVRFLRLDALEAVAGWQGADLTRGD